MQSVLNKFDTLFELGRDIRGRTNLSDFAIMLLLTIYADEYEYEEWGNPENLTKLFQNAYELNGRE